MKPKPKPTQTKRRKIFGSAAISSKTKALRKHFLEAPARERRKLAKAIMEMMREGYGSESDPWVWLPEDAQKRIEQLLKKHGV